MIGKTVSKLHTLLNYKRGNTCLRSMPPSLWIEPTNACNLRCKMCFQSNGMSRQQGFMDMTLYKNIIDTTHRFVDRINLYLAGEPFLHPRIFDMIRHAKKYNLKVRIHTNATLLTKDRCHEIISSGLDILSLSFDAISPQYYEETRKGAKFDQTLANIRYLLQHKIESQSKSPYTIIEIIENEHTADHIQTFIKQYQDLPVDKFNIARHHSWGGRFLSGTKEAKALPACQYLWNSLSILWDGTVVPCCLDFDAKCVLGNIRDQSLATIWNNTTIREMREKQTQHKRVAIALCKGCDKAEF
ncbi:MAG: hypothetical protein A2520_06465 [Deltaproteobacteria bacterium RIFOXYD12_FULL_53_23]|nr:MAG: hypothetical protein A2520_06465 [Deltaproteobacteria bacterium RIFOXYD12_FULL_53_23]